MLDQTTYNRIVRFELRVESPEIRDWKVASRIRNLPS